MSMIYDCAECDMPYCVSCDGGQDQCPYCSIGPLCNDCAVEHRDSEHANLEVIVGNIGTVYSGRDKAEATKKFDAYVELSKEEIGRAAGENVVLMVNGEPEDEFIGRLHENDDEED